MAPMRVSTLTLTRHGNVGSRASSRTDRRTDRRTGGQAGKQARAVRSRNVQLHNMGKGERSRALRGIVAEVCHKETFVHYRRAVILIGAGAIQHGP